MGQELVKLFKLVKDEGSLSQRMKIGKLTGITSDEADDFPDSVENVAKVKAAIQKVLGIV